MSEGSKSIPIITPQMRAKMDRQRKEAAEKECLRKEELEKKIEEQKRQEKIRQDKLNTDLKSLLRPLENIGNNLHNYASELKKQNTLSARSQQERDRLFSDIQSILDAKKGIQTMFSKLMDSHSLSESSVQSIRQQIVLLEQKVRQVINKIGTFNGLLKKELEEYKKTIKEKNHLESDLQKMSQKRKQQDAAFNRLHQQINSEEKQLNKSEEKLENLDQEIKTLQIKIRETKTQRVQTLELIQTLSNDTNILYEKANSQVKSWEQLNREVEKLHDFSQKVENLTKEMENDISLLITSLVDANSELVKAEKELSEAREISHQLNADYNHISNVVNMLTTDSTTNMAAFIELQVLRNQGFDLSSIQTGEEVKMFFESKTNDESVAVVIKDITENEGLKWLRELRTFNVDDIEEFNDNHIEALEEIGVRYDFKGKNTPSIPPGGEGVEWMKSRRRSDSIHKRSNKA